MLNSSRLILNILRNQTGPPPGSPPPLPPPEQEPDELHPTSETAPCSPEPEPESVDVDIEEVNNTNTEETETGMENNRHNIHSHHVIYEQQLQQQPLAPRLPPDGHEFPNSWLDEESKTITAETFETNTDDEKISSKLYRSEYNLRTTTTTTTATSLKTLSSPPGNMHENTTLRPYSPPPPPPPRTAPPQLEEDFLILQNQNNLPPPVIPSTPPPALSRSRRSSIDERRKLYEISTALTQGQQQGQIQINTKNEKANEPSRKSVKDKIAMFSNSSNNSIDDGTPVNNGITSSPSLLTNNKSHINSNGNGNGYNSSSSSLVPETNGFSKSSDNLPGITSGTLEPFNISNGNSISQDFSTDVLNSWKMNKSTTDLRQQQNQQIDEPKDIVDTCNNKNQQTSYLYERSQSLLNVGQIQSNAPPTIIEERRRGTISKLRGLVIPDKPSDIGQNSVSVMDLPTIYSKDAPLKPIPNSKPSSRLLPPIQPVPMARKHLGRTESLDRMSSSSSSSSSIESNSNKIINHHQPIIKPSPSSQLSTTTTPTDLNDWKFSSALPKYSPAFKRRSLSAYQTAITSPTMKSKLSANFKNTTNTTPEPKSLESCTSPRSDSSFEYSSPTSDQPKIVAVTTISSLKRNTTTTNYNPTPIVVNTVNVMKPVESKIDNLKSGKGYPRRNSNGRLVEDSDTDSAVSSSRSSISHELSPPNSPTPTKQMSQQQQPHPVHHNNLNSTQQRYGNNGDNQQSTDVTSTTEDSANNSDEGWRILKPQSVEAINRKNVLASAKYSNGFLTAEQKANNLAELEREHNNGRGGNYHHTRRSDDEEASYADAETEDTESSCSELETGKSRRSSGPTIHHVLHHKSSTNNSVINKRPITDTEDDDDEDELNTKTQTIEQQQHQIHQIQQQQSPPLGTVQKSNESPLQAIYDIEAKMAYINDICDSLPCTRHTSHQENRFFSRRDSEATVIEHPIERKSSTSSSTLTLTSSEHDLRMPKTKSISSNSSIEDVEFSNENAFGSRKNSLVKEEASLMMNTQKSSSRRGSVEDSQKNHTLSEFPTSSSSGCTLEKKYSTSMTSVNLINTAMATTTTSLKMLGSFGDNSISSPITTTTATTLTPSISNTVESKVEKLIEKKTTSTTFEPTTVKTKTPAIPRGRNDFKSLSEKWQQISSTATPTTTAVPNPISNPIEPKITPMPPSSTIANNLLKKKEDDRQIKLGESRERKPWIPPRHIEQTSLSPSNSLATGSPITSTSSSSSTKRSVSVNDIRKAFEKAEMAVNTYGRDDNSSNDNMNGKNNGKEIDSGSILSPPSAHFRVSSFDSTTSEDSSVNTPAGIYGSSSNLMSSSSSAQKDPYGSITSLASSTSLISPQELQQLIDEANQSLEEAGTPSHEVSVVILHREFTGGSLGITLAGGADYETKEITVHKVLSASIADRDGRIHRGDRVLSINGKSTKGATHREALNLLKAPRQEVVLVISRGRTTGSNGFQTIEETTATLDRAVEPLLNGSLSSLLENDEDTKYNWGPMRTVILVKDGAGLGFSLEGGQGSITGDKPLTIKKIFVGGPAEKSGALKVGDLITSINDVNMSTKSRTEAWNFMKKLSDGEVKLMVKSPM